MSDKIRIGIDLGGTKIEVLAIDRDGKELTRHRVATPRHDYAGSIKLMAELVARLESETGKSGTVGVAIPGSISAVTGLIKNANSVWLNGRPLDKDLSAAMGREVRCVNDANCLAVSEATDGAGAGAAVVFAAILGTGTGAGIAFQGRAHNGPNGIAGEWGHNPLPWPSAGEYPGPACYCGKHGCLETWISGSGLEADYERNTGTHCTGREILALSVAGDAVAEAAVRRYESRLTRGLAHVINVLDPDVIVLGGGMSRIERLYPALNANLRDYVFGREFATPIRPALHGDSSGIRGAAWLWPKD
ncbi:fructokinase [Dongia sp.]|uniref:fructokinase n=1 Tax=Dongia sp. TaxID=1977262 RepID=UPI0037502A29